MRTLVAASLAALAALGLAAPAVSGVRSETAALQVALTARGLYQGPLDGLAGTATVTALTRFQRDAGLPVTGRLDRRTRLALGTLGRPLGGRRALGLGNVGWDVSVAEFRLARLGFVPGRIDGRFDADTRAAVRRFQRYAGLAPDGRLGPRTFRALRRARPARSPVKLAWPLQRRVVRRFGPSGRTFHPGIDIAAPYAAGIAAAGDGRVVWAGWSPGGLGLVVTIAHGRGVRSTYAHLARVDVRVGQRVVRGALIGLVGWTGEAKRSHLHLEVRVRGASVDPLTVLR